MLQVAETGSMDERAVRSAAGGEVQENRRAAHPHMNNLVYGRRSDPAVATRLHEELSGTFCRQVIDRCARSQRLL